MQRTKQASEKRPRPSQRHDRSTLHAGSLAGERKNSAGSDAFAGSEGCAAGGRGKSGPASARVGRDEGVRTLRLRCVARGGWCGSCSRGFEFRTSLATCARAFPAAARLTVGTTRRTSHPHADGSRGGTPGDAVCASQPPREFVLGTNRPSEWSDVHVADCEQSTGRRVEGKNEQGEWMGHVNGIPSTSSLLSRSSSSCHSRPPSSRAVTRRPISFHSPSTAGASSQSDHPAHTPLALSSRRVHSTLRAVLEATASTLAGAESQSLEKLPPPRAAAAVSPLTTHGHHE